MPPVGDMLKDGAMSGPAVAPVISDVASFPRVCMSSASTCTSVACVARMIPFNMPEAPMLVPSAFGALVPTDSAADTQSGQSQPAHLRHDILHAAAVQFLKI